MKKNLLKKYFLFGICICSLCLTFSLYVYGQTSTCSSLYSISRPLSKYADAGTKWGYIDCKGNIIASTDFDEVFDFNEGIGVLVNGEDSILIDVKGNRKILPGTRILTKYSEGVAIAAKQKGYFIIDKNGNIKAELPEESEEEKPYFFVSHFSNGLAPVSTVNGIGFIDKTGKLVIAPIYKYTNGFRDNMAAVPLDGKFALIDTSGKFIILPIDKTISDPSDGLVNIQGENDEWLYFDEKGENVLKVKYDYAGNFVEGLARVSNDEGLWGFIDKKGKEVIPLKFDDVGDFSEGLARAEKESKFGFIDKTGKFVIPPIFDTVADTFKNGLIYVSKDGMEGYIDKEGKWIWKRKS